MRKYKKILSSLLSLALVLSVFCSSFISQVYADNNELPEIISFENDSDRSYFTSDSKASVISLSSYQNVNFSKAVLGNTSAKALRLGGKNEWAQIDPVYTDGKGYNAMSGKIGLRNSNDCGIIYDYTDDNNFKGFRIGNVSQTVYINTYVRTNGIGTEGKKVEFQTAEFVNSAYTVSDSLVQFFNFKLTYSNGVAIFTVTSDSYDKSQVNNIVPEVTASGTGLNCFRFWGCDQSQYQSKFADDLKIYVDSTLSCEHEATQTADAQYLKSTANCVSPAVYYEHCSKCGTVLLSTFTSGAATDHSHEEIATEAALKSRATCKSVAVYYKSCGGCGKLWTDETFLGAELGTHGYVNGICRYCNAEMPAGQQVLLNFEKQDDIKSVGSVEGFVSGASRVPLPANSTNNESAFVMQNSGAIKPDLTYGMGYNMISGKVGLGSGCNAEIIYDYTDANNYKAFKVGRYYSWTQATGMTASWFLVSKITVTDGKITESDHSQKFDPTFYTDNDTKSGVVFLDFELNRISGGIATFKITSSCYLDGTQTSYEPIVRNFCDNDDYVMLKTTRAEYGRVYYDNIRVYLDTEYQACNHSNTAQVASSDYLVSAATCQSPAVYYESCADCGARMQATFTYGDKGAHTLTFFEKVLPDCINDIPGTESYYKCSLCGLMFKDGKGASVIDAPVKIPAAHYYDGYTYDESGHWKVCKVCNTAKTATVAHGLKNTVKTGALKLAATCHSKAVYYKSCDCGYISSTETFETGSFSAHTLIRHDRIEPTCTTVGTDEYWNCSVCDKYFKDSAGNIEISVPISIPNTHKFGEYLSDSEYHWYHCTECGYETPKNVHTPNVSLPVGTDKVCTECGYRLAKAIDILPAVLGAKLYTGVSDIGDDLRIRFDIDFSKLLGNASAVDIEEFGVIAVTDYTGNMTAGNIAFDATEKSYIRKTPDEISNLENGIMKVYVNRKLSQFGIRVALVGYLKVDGEYYYSSNTVGTDGSVVKNGVASKCVADMMRAVFVKGQYSDSDISSAIMSAMEERAVADLFEDYTSEEARSVFDSYVSGELRPGTALYAAAKTLLIYTYYCINL